jgi:ABC-type amino acid transport substrate-binding protein
MRAPETRLELRVWSNISAVTLAAACLLLPCGPAEAPPGALRVCAEADNLPFSNVRREGFENRIAELVGREVGAELVYVWWTRRPLAPWTGSSEPDCDLILGVPHGGATALTTRPYFGARSIAVGPGDARLRDLLDSVLQANHDEIRRIVSGAPRAFAPVLSARLTTD